MRGKTQDVRIDSDTITISEQSGKSISIPLNDIVGVNLNGNTVEIEHRSSFSAARTSVEFPSYSDAADASRRISAATPALMEIQIEGNILRIRPQSGFGGKSIRAEEIREARADRSGVLEIQGYSSFDSLTIQRKSASIAQQEASMIQAWLEKRKEKAHGADAQKNASTQQEERRADSNFSMAQRRGKSRTAKLLLKLIAVPMLAGLGLVILYNIADRLIPTQEKLEKEYSYTDSLNNQYSYTISYAGAEPTVYSRTPNQLIDEWKSNVAKAENTYQKENVYITTDGYIESINKDEADDSYYIQLVEDADEWSILGSNEIRVSFRGDREYEALLEYGTGDHIALLCYSDKTSFFLEYPELEASLVLTPKPSASANENSSDLENGSKAWSSTALVDYIGITVADIEKQFGTEYEVDWLDGGYWMFYSNEPGLPYGFLYAPAQGYDYSDTMPKADDLIYGAFCCETDVAVIGEARIGMEHDDFASAIGLSYTAEVEPDSEYTLPSAYFSILYKNAHDREENEYWMSLMELDECVVSAEIYKKIS